ncbi:response regulator [Paenibacillus sp. IB182496]|uniref:histidine kinase n=1 Tax=Paenibacillus sabuli TaxID=2772509 RepID=A0A927GTR3_9BACL|nr:ATP-binding protein [Paenibacillus sabuli]MBD2848129.1 response regulator [Paenibacillus sabuli]
MIAVVLLTAGRLTWLKLFESSGQPYAVDGVLDLQGWSDWENRTLSLDGEWRFYPNSLLAPGHGEDVDLSIHGSGIEVPGGWNTRLNPESRSPYGFGSYRLTIRVPPERDAIYSVYMPEVRNASRLYANGRLVAGSGVPAASEAAHVSDNRPYTGTFAPDEQGRIELIVQVANFTDSRNGGLVRTLKFGTAEAIASERQLSMAVQVFVAAALLIQAVFLLVFFVMERRRFWLFLALALIGFTVILLNSSEDKLLVQWFSLTLEWSYRLLCLSLVLLSYSLLQTVIDTIPPKLRPWMQWGYGLAALIGTAASLTVTVKNNQPLQYAVFILSTPITVLLLRRYIPRLGAKAFFGNPLQLLAYAAFMNHVLWWTLYESLGLKLLYYPFDLILGMLLLSSIWIRRYYALYTDQKALTARLEEMIRQKDAFLANTSHELRNPLHGMINMTEAVLARERARLEGRSRGELETVLRVGRRMAHMLNDLLDAARLRERMLELQLTSVALHPIVQGVMDMLRFMCEGKPVALVNRVAAELPNVYADEHRLIQILFNLLHNALKFTHQGEVGVTARIGQGRVVVLVSDTGIGMTPETQARVFEPYEQADRDDDREGGFGLGLSITRQLVELHGGSLRVHSAPGEGAEFVFELNLDASSEPRVQLLEEAHEQQAAAIAVGPAAPAEALASGQSEAADRPRILAVDDDAFNLRILRSILDDDAYDIVTVTSGAEALALVDAHAWDLVVTDVMMPLMSGYTLTRRIRERYAVSELPILLLTARSQPEDIEQGFLAGANDYVTKPVEPRELRARVQALTELKRSVRERLRMEAAWLQAQIEPHFLLNTLNSIAALQAIDPARMNELIVHFGDYLREKFKFQNVGELVSLHDELTLVRAYVYIEQTRFRERLQVEWDIDDDTEQLLLPPYSIQPLVENAIRHGVTQRRQGGTVRIVLKRLADVVAISVADDGVGMTAETVRRLLQPHPGGIGLRNVDLRLKRLYGAGLVIESAPAQGTAVSFRVGAGSLSFKKTFTFIEK